MWSPSAPSLVSGTLQVEASSLIWLTYWFSRRHFALPLLLGFALLGFLMIMLMHQSDQREFEVTFLQQCHDAGYDPAKCRFFLTMSSRRAVSDDVMREVVLTPK